MKQESTNGGASSSYVPTSSPYQYDSAAYQASGAYTSAPTPASAADPYQQHYPSFQQQQQQQQQYQATPASTKHTYQEAYAQAYAAIMAQVQAATAAGGAFASFPPQAPMGMHGAPPPPTSFPPQSNAFGPGYGASIPTPPFPGAAGFTPASQMHHGPSVGGDDGLANLLLAWYQSGYYTGRFQAMQEMKSRTRR